MDIKDMSDDEILVFLRSRKSHKMSREIEKLKSINIGEHMEANGIRIECPVCHSIERYNNGLNDSGSQRYKCKKCGKGYTATTNTIFDGCNYSWEEMVKVVKETLNDTTITTSATSISKNRMKENTIWIIRRKIIRILANMPPEKLEGVIQMDEKYFRETQKGSRSLVNMLEPDKNRKRRKNRQASKAGIFGPEFVNVLCAVDEHGYWWAKPVCLGPMGLDELKQIEPFLERVSYICSDAYSIYSVWCAENKYKHYIEPSTYRRERKLRGYVDTDDMYKTLTQEEYEKDKKINESLYRDGIYPHIENPDRKLSYDEFCAIRYKFNLTINGVNSCHSILESNWSGTRVGSTDYIADFIGKEVFLHNYRLKNQIKNTSYTYEEAEKILVMMIKKTLADKHSPTTNEVLSAEFFSLPRPSKKAIKDALKAMVGLRNYIQFEKDGENDERAYEGDNENTQYVFNKYKFFSQAISTERRNDLIIANGLYRKGMLKEEKVRLLAQLPNAQDVIFSEIYLSNYGTFEEFKKTMSKLPKVRNRK